MIKENFVRRLWYSATHLENRKRKTSISIIANVPKLNFQAFQGRHATRYWKRRTTTVPSFSWKEHIENDSRQVNRRFSSRNARREEKEKCYILELKFQIGSSRNGEKVNIECCTCAAFDLCYSHDKDQFRVVKFQSNSKMKSRMVSAKFFLQNSLTMTFKAWKELRGTDFHF